MNLPLPRTTEQQLMVAVCELLGEQTQLLIDIRDRLADQANGTQSTGSNGSGAAGAENGGAVELKEPAAPPAPADTDPAAKPRKQAARKTSTRRSAKGTA